MYLLIFIEMLLKMGVSQVITGENSAVLKVLKHSKEQTFSINYSISLKQDKMGMQIIFSIL